MNIDTPIDEADRGAALYDSRPWLRDLDILNVQTHPWLLHFVDEHSSDEDGRVAAFEIWYQQDGTAPKHCLLCLVSQSWVHRQRCSGTFWSGVG